MKTSTLETLIWVLIYGGLIVLSLSVFITHELSMVLAIGGVLATVAGAFLIWVRSRMKNGSP